MPTPRFTGPAPDAGCCHHSFHLKLSRATSDALLHAIAGEGNLVELVAIFQTRVILQTELNRVHPQLLGDRIHVDFLSESSLGMTHTAHRSAVRIVGVDRIALSLHVGTTVGIHHHLHGSVGTRRVIVGTHVRDRLRLDRRQSTVLFDSIFQFTDYGIAVVSGDVEFVPVKFNPCGTPRLTRDQGSQNIVPLCRTFVPKPTPHEIAYHPHFAHGELKSFGDTLLYLKCSLRRVPEGQLAGFPLCDCNPAFRGGMLQNRSSVSAFVDQISLREAFRQIAPADYRRLATYQIALRVQFGRVRA